MSKQGVDIFLQLHSLTQELWDAKKALAYSRSEIDRRRIFARIKKLVASLKALEWDREIELLELFYNLKKPQDGKVE